jgi:hypothetical protein
MHQLFESRGAQLGVLAVMFGLLEVGRRVGQRRLKRDPEGANLGVGTLDGAVFGLMGLLVAFSFSGAATRFDARRELILAETNAIGTAWLRLDLLPESVREAVRADMRRYVDLRLAATRAAELRADTSITQLQQNIWTQAVTAARSADDPRIAHVVLPALNEVFDLATARYLATQTHPPPIIFVMLVLLAFTCALLAGYGMAGSKEHSWLHIVSFAGTLLLAIYVILDLEFPRRGFIRIERYDQVLIELRASMK